MRNVVPGFALGRQTRLRYNRLMADDPSDVMERLYREILNVRTAVDEQIGTTRTGLSALRGDILTHFDEVYRRFDRLGRSTTLS